MNNEQNQQIDANAVVDSLVDQIANLSLLNANLNAVVKKLSEDKEELTKEVEKLRDQLVNEMNNAK